MRELEDAGLAERVTEIKTKFGRGRGSDDLFLAAKLIMKNAGRQKLLAERHETSCAGGPNQHEDTFVFCSPTSRTVRTSSPGEAAQPGAAIARRCVLLECLQPRSYDRGSLVSSSFPSRLILGGYLVLGKVATHECTLRPGGQSTL